MRSSISSSDAALFYSKAVLVVCALAIVALEFTFSYPLKHRSATYRRVAEQYAAAVGSRPAQPGEPVSVLMVGNSLLLDGVDVDRLRKSTAASVRFYPLFLEGTAYFDWFYGLERLFRHGARPEIVVVGLGIDGVLDNGVRQEYAPMMLFDARDVLAVSWEAGLDRTVTSSFLLAHWSAFWDMRHVIRVQLMTHTIPYFERFYLSDLWSHLRAKRVVPVGPEQEAIAVARVERLRRLAERYGARVLMLIPPTPTLPGAVRQMSDVARLAGVDSLIPVDPATLPATAFRDDQIHVNDTGTALFTAALAVHLPAKIARPGPTARLDAARLVADSPHPTPHLVRMEEAAEAANRSR